MEDHRSLTMPVADDEPSTPASLRASLPRRRAAGPATVDDQYDRGTHIARFNSALAVAITKGVGSMWCAYGFAALTLLSLPSALQTGLASTVQWIAQTFLQLVLLSIILVGQNVQAAAADKRAQDTYRDTEEILHQVSQIHAHQMGQDTALRHQQAILGELHTCLSEATRDPAQSPPTSEASMRSVSKPADGANPKQIRNDHESDRRRAN
ncbi:MAG: hypothetical protein JO287_26040 [Pseudonocardiales bacterium]|nr:hypothetical protein [Pseudonocardiales bacterium]